VSENKFSSPFNKKNRLAFASSRHSLRDLTKLELIGAVAGMKNIYFQRYSRFGFAVRILNSHDCLCGKQNGKALNGASYACAVANPHK